MSRIKILKIGKASQIRLDWLAEGDVLLAYYKKYRLEYREKICTKCIGTQQQKDRNCFIFSYDGKGNRKDGTPELDENGNPKTDCNHLTIAIHKRNIKRAKAHTFLGNSFCKSNI